MTRAIFLALATLMSLTAGATEREVIGRVVIEWVSAPPRATSTVLLVGGLNGPDASVALVREQMKQFEKLRTRQRGVRLAAIALANPNAERLKFPPAGVAYRDQPEAHVLWRWIGTHAPDLVLIAGPDDIGFAETLSQNAVAEVGSIPARALVPGELLRMRTLEPSAAHREIDRRLARSPRQFATELAQHYGRDFDTPWYINAVALIARARLGDLDDVKRLAEPYVDGTRDSLERPNSLVLGGHLIFTELARRTGDPRYVQAVRKIGELGFEADGTMKESMPWHDQYSDSVFMATPIVAQAGALTGDRKYFDLAVRHFEFMQKIVLRPDGLYRHQPLTDAAWGRGNAFVAVGLALTLTELPQDHPGYARLLQAFRHHMAMLARYQTRDGLWRNVIDVPEAYPEFSATAMIGFALQRGVRQGWLEEKTYRGAIERAWRAVLTRAGPEGRLVDVCESTTRMKSVDEYLRRAALLGQDPRGGAMAMLFATELVGPTS